MTRDSSGGGGRKRSTGGTAMTPEAAARIQAAADQSGTNSDFKARAMRAAARKANAPQGDAPRQTASKKKV